MTGHLNKCKVPIEKHNDTDFEDEQLPSDVDCDILLNDPDVNRYIPLRVTYRLGKTWSGLRQTRLSDSEPYWSVAKYASALTIVSTVSTKCSTGRSVLAYVPAVK